MIMSGERPYVDRLDAGRVLADQLGAELARVAGELDHDQRDAEPVVLALPRGGVPVAVPVAARLGVPVSVLVVRKLGAPGQPELAVGAIAAIGDQVWRVLNADWVPRLGLSTEQLAAITATETRELRHRVALFGATPPVSGRTVVVVDDGLATGATMRAAVTALRSAGAAFIVAAVPVGAVGACEELGLLVDLLVCPRRPDPFRAVGEHYRDFSQLTDEDVRTLLEPPAPPRHP